MGRLIAKKLNELEWGLAGCLLFLGISSPAFHQFYKKKGYRLTGIRQVSPDSGRTGTGTRFAETLRP